MEDWTPIVVAIISVVGVALSSGIIQFFVNRKDQQRQTSLNVAIEELRKEFQKGLDEREATGASRYEEHQKAINEMKAEHVKDFKALQNAIDQLAKNDTRITNNIEEIAKTQSVIAESHVGQAHDRIIFLIDRIAARGSITNKEKATIKSMYEPYRKLGGNGEVKEAFEYAMTLPTVSDDKARQLDLDNRRKEYREIVGYKE